MVTLKILSTEPRCGKKDCFCGQNCGQSLPELESTKEPGFNLPQEVKVKRGEQNLPELESTEEPSFNLPLEVTVSSGEQNSSELKSTEEQSFNLPQEVKVSSVSETLPYNSPDSNSGDASPTDDESDSDSDLDLTGGSSSSNEAEQQPEAASWISNITKRAKGWYSPRKLEEFYPLTEEDAALLRRRTGRNYELSYVNKLLIKHSEKSPNNRFPCKEAVLNYMKKTLIHEMRPPSMANNPNFNFGKNNAIKARETRLRKVENNKDTKPLSQLKRKIVGAFDSDIADEILMKCSFFGVCDDEYKIDLADISLSESDKDTLLKQVQEVYGKEVQQLRITNKRTPSDYYLELSELNPESVWYKIRKYLIKLYGELIDKAWFSKLEAIEEDTTCNKLILKPPSPFVGDWIINHYGRVLEEACSSHNYTFEFMKVDRMA
ncbi:MAG: hypothetical protein LF885_03025 [Rickettsia endosymbiont of Culicoides impunctatus]|nr:MAG: hypothetical protein LF885_03025 [Rickettsia endosymbiont of Culicoides impunctatus]